MKVFRPMKISEFQSEHSPEVQKGKALQLRETKSKGRPAKPELSPGEIRAKVEELKNKSSPNIGDLSRKRAQYEAEAKESTAPEVKSSEEVLSDVGLNDPKDPMTTEKLKGVLEGGGINFSAKEREVLAGILGQK